MKILTPKTDVSRHWKCAMLKYNNIQPTYEIQQRQPEQINAQAEDAIFCFKLFKNYQLIIEMF